MDTTITKIVRTDWRADHFVTTRDPFKTIILLPATQIDAPTTQPSNTRIAARWQKGPKGLTMRWVTYSADER